MIIDKDIDIYTASSEQQLRLLRNCMVADEDMYRARLEATEKVRLALIELRIVLNSKVES